MKFPVLCTFALVTFPTIPSFSQAFQNIAAEHPVDELKLEVCGTLPSPALEALREGQVRLLPGLFRQRRELAKAYLLRLKTDNLLQNHYLEAGMRIETPIEQMHLGWETPSCQLRGHFVGHWISALSMFATKDGDQLARQRVEEAVGKLDMCQQYNGGQWVGSIPTKFFDILEDRQRWVWSPQYTLHKTMMGLYDAYLHLGDKEALEVAERSADWFMKWTDGLVAKGRSDVIYGGECAGMLELWADLYAATGNERYLTLASRYAMPDMFTSLLDGGDPLSNDHANASIPWIQGAARLYEATGDVRFRNIVEAFWKCAVEERGMFATTGNNAGEFWIPKQQFGRFLGNRTQEHCTVYNMIRVAQYLLRWTGDAKYADYIERALFNGILAQQNPHTGMVAYFLPLEPGSHKEWGGETRDFWCCTGTTVQAQAMHEDLIYFTSSDGVIISQFIPSEASLHVAGGAVRLTQRVDWNNSPREFAAQGDATHVRLELGIKSEAAASWTLRIRQPEWASGPASVTIDGAPASVKVSSHGFIEITRVWNSQNVSVTFPKSIRREALPGDANRFALLDGPIVLAAICEREPELLEGEPIVPQYEHLYIDGQQWQTGHFLARTSQGTVRLRPLFEVVDETYCVYFTEAK
jgi:hypothetical protein